MSTSSTTAMSPPLKTALVAKLFQVDPRTIGRWVKANKLSITRTPYGHRLYSETEIRGLLGIPDGANLVVEASRLHTPAEVAVLLRVHPKTVVQWAKAGKLNSIRTPTHRRFRDSVIRGLLRVPEGIDLSNAEYQLLTTSEVAAILRVDMNTVTRWAKAGKLSSIRTPGGDLRYWKTGIRAG